MICVQCIFHLIIKWKCLRGVSSSSIMGMLSCWFRGQVFTKLTLCQLFSDYTLPMFCDFLLSSMVCVSDRRWLSTLSKCHLILPNPPNTLLIRPSETSETQLLLWPGPWNESALQDHVNEKCDLHLGYSRQWHFLHQYQYPLIDFSKLLRRTLEIYTLS